MKRLAIVILALAVLLTACARPPVQTPPTTDLPALLLEAAPIAAYSAQTARKSGDYLQFAPFSDREPLSLSAEIPLYTLIDGQLQASEQTLYLVLDESGVEGEVNWPKELPVFGSFTPLSQAQACFTFYHKQSFDRNGEQVVALLNDALAVGTPIAFVRADQQTWLLHENEATLLSGSDTEGGFADSQTVEKAAKNLPRSVIEPAQTFAIATWEQYHYEYSAVIRPYEGLDPQTQIQITLLDELIYTPVPTDDLCLMEPIPVYVARDGQLNEEPVTLQPIFSGETCVGYALIYNAQLLQLRLYDPRQPGKLGEGLTEAFASGETVALLSEQQSSYLLVGGSALGISSYRPQADRDGLGNRAAVEKSAWHLRSVAVTRAEELSFALSVPDQATDPMGRGMTLHLLRRALLTGEAADLSDLSLSDPIPTYTYTADEQLELSTKQLVPLFRGQTLLGAMYWSAWQGEGLSSGFLWADEYPEIFATLQHAFETGAECCVIEDAQQIWLACGGEAFVIQTLPSFDQYKACLENAEIAAIAAQSLQRVTLAPTRPLAQ